MSGSSRHTSAGRQLSSHHSSGADSLSKAPVKFQIQTTKRLALVQYSDDDSSESAPETQQSFVRKVNVLVSQGSKPVIEKSSSTKSDFESVSSKILVKDAHLQAATAARTDVKSSKSVPREDSVKHRSAEQRSRHEEQLPTRRSSEDKRFSNSHDLSYNRSRDKNSVNISNDFEKSPKISDVDKNISKHTSDSSRSKPEPAYDRNSKTHLDKGQPSSKSSAGENLSEKSYGVERKSREHRSERHETRVEKDQKDVSISRNDQDKTKTSKSSGNRNKSTLEEHLQSSEREKRLDERNERYKKHHELQIFSEKKHVEESSSNPRKSGNQLTDEKRKHKELQTSSYKHTSDHSRQHLKHRESPTQYEENINKKALSREISELSEIRDIRETDSKLHQHMVIPKMSSLNSLDIKQKWRCETQQITDPQFRCSKDALFKDYEKHKVSLNSSDISSKEKKFTAQEAAKSEIVEISLRGDEKSNPPKSNKSLHESDSRKESFRSVSNQISSEYKSDKQATLSTNQIENKNITKRDCNSGGAHSKKVNSKLPRISSSASDDSSTSSSEDSSSDEVSSSSSSSSSTSSYESKKKGKSRKSKKVVEWVEVKKPVIERVSANKSDNIIDVMKESSLTADCRKKTHSDSRASHTETNNKVWKEHSLVDDNTKRSDSAIKSSRDKRFGSDHSSVQNISAANTSTEILAIKEVLDQTVNEYNKNLKTGKISTEIYSPSAPTGWDVDDKPGNVCGWSSDSDIENSVLELSPVQPPLYLSGLQSEKIENSVLELSPVQPPPCLSGLQSEKLAKLMVNSVLAQSLECADLEKLSRSRIEPAQHKTEMGRRAGTEATSQYIGADESGKIKDSHSEMRLSENPSLNKMQSKLNCSPKTKNDVERIEKAKQEKCDSVKTKEIHSVTTHVEDFNGSSVEIREASSMGSTKKATVKAHSGMEKQQEKITSSREAQWSNTLASLSSSLVQNKKHDSSANLTKSSIRSESDDHNSRRRRDRSPFSVSRERTRHRHSSPWSRSPSYESSRERKRTWSLRRSRSRERVSQRREPMLLSISSSTRQGSNRSRKSKEKRASSHSSDSDDVVILEDYDLISEKPSCSEMTKNGSNVCKTSCDTISPGILDLNSIPLPLLPDSIPLPIHTDSIPVSSMQEPVQCNDFNVTEQSSQSIVLNASFIGESSGSVDMDLDSSNVDMDLDSSNNSGNSQEIQTVEMDLNNSLTDVDIITGCDRNSKANQGLVSSIVRLAADEDVAALATTDGCAGGQSLPMRNLIEAVQSQVAVISSTTIESPRSADEALPSSQNTKSTPGKIVLSLNDRRKKEEDSLNASTLWKRKLASNLLKPIKFNIPAAITISQTALSSDDDDDYESDRSLEVTGVRDAITVPKSCDILGEKAEKKGEAAGNKEQSVPSLVSDIAVVSSQCQGLKVTHSDLVRSAETALNKVQSISSSDTNAGVPPRLVSGTNVYLSDSSMKSVNVEQESCGLPIVVIVGHEQSCEIEKPKFSPRKIETISSSQHSEKSFIQILGNTHGVPLLSKSQTPSKHSTSEIRGESSMPPSTSNDQRKPTFGEQLRPATHSKSVSESKVEKTLQSESVGSCIESVYNIHKQKQHSSLPAAKDSNIPTPKLDPIIKRSKTPDTGIRHGSSSRHRHSRSASRTSRDQLEFRNSSSKHKLSESSHSKRNSRDRCSRSRSRQKRRRRSSSSRRSSSHHRQGDSTTHRLNSSSKRRRSRSSSRKKDNKDSSSKSNRSLSSLEKNRSKYSIEGPKQKDSSCRLSNDTERFRKSRSASIERGVQTRIERSNASTEQNKEISVKRVQTLSGDQKNAKRLISEQVASPSSLQDDSRSQSLYQNYDRRPASNVCLSPDRKRNATQLNVAQIEAVDNTWKEQLSNSHGDALRLASPAAFITSSMGRIDQTIRSDLSDDKNLPSYIRGKDDQFVDELNKDEMLHDVSKRSFSSSLKSFSHDSFAIRTTCKIDSVNTSSRTEKPATVTEVVSKEGVRKTTRWEKPSKMNDVHPISSVVKDIIVLPANHLKDQQSHSTPSTNRRVSPKSTPSQNRFRSCSIEKDHSGSFDIIRFPEQREVHGSNHRDQREATGAAKRRKRSLSRERPKILRSRSRSASRPRLSRGRRSYSRELRVERSDERLVDQQQSVYIYNSTQGHEDLKNRDFKSHEDLHKLHRSADCTTEQEFHKMLQSGAHKSQSLKNREEQLSPVSKRYNNLRDRSPCYVSLKTSVERNSPVPRENKSADYVRQKSPVVRDSVHRKERMQVNSISSQSSSVSRHMHSEIDTTPDIYYGSNTLTSSAKHQSYSQENRSPDYRSRINTPIKHHSQSRAKKSPGYDDGSSRSSSLKHRTSPLRDKSPARHSRFVHEDNLDEYIDRPRSPVRRSPVRRSSVRRSPGRHQPRSSGDDLADVSARSLSPTRHQSRSSRDTLPDTSSSSPSRYHRRRLREETSPSSGRLSPSRLHSGAGEEALRDYGGSRSRIQLPSNYSDLRSPDRHLSYSPGRKVNVSPTVRYDECVSPSMSITSLPDQDIIINEALDKPMDRCFNNGQIKTADIYSEIVAPQNQGTYAPPMPYASFPLGANHPSYQCIAAPSTGTTGWYQLPIAPPPAAIPLPNNFSSFGSTWNEPYNSGVVVMPGVPQVQSGVFSQSLTQHPSNSYITQAASQFGAPTANQALQPVACLNSNLDVWSPQPTYNTYQQVQASYKELPDSSEKSRIKQSCQSYGEANPIPVVGSSTAVEPLMKRAPSPQWTPLPDKFRDKFRPSFDDRTSRKPHFDASVIDSISTSSFERNDKLSESDISNATPDVGMQLNRQIVETEDPRCCCLWEAVPEVFEDTDMAAVSNSGEREVTQKAKKRHGKHLEDNAGIAMVRRRSSRFKSAQDVDSHDNEKLITSEAKTEDEQREPVSSLSHQSLVSDDGSERSKQLSGIDTPISNNALLKPEKVKSRWRRWSELETDTTAPPPPPPPAEVLSKDVTHGDAKVVDDQLDNVEEKQPYFEEVIDNIFLSSRDMKKSRKEARNMICDCTPPSAEELVRGVTGCSEDCLNRMLLIECGSRCPCGDLCTNKLFQRHQYSKVKCFKTDYKGWGLQADEDLPPGSFIMEYVGEVLDPREFKSRIKKYARENYEHHYFMALNADEVIDATKKGNVSRFVNHCCDPNSETQKWTVNGQLRIGFFTIKPVKAGEELTFDYQFETYGQEATKCYCGASNCRGTIDVGRRSPSKKRGVKLAAKVKEIKRMPGMFSDIFLEEEIEMMSSMGGLRRKDDVLELNRLMLRAESLEHRAALLKALQDTKEPACLRLFLDYHGLALLWSWMVDVTTNDFSFKTQVLNTLKLLPIGNKTILRDSRIMSVIEKWANQLTVEKTQTTTDQKATASGGTITTGESLSESDAKLSESSSSVPLAAGSERLVMNECSRELTDVTDELVADVSLATTKSEVQAAVETVSNCDEEPMKTDVRANDRPEGDTSMLTTADSTGISVSRDEDNTLAAAEEETLDRQAVSAVTDLAAYLLSEWANLKEAYKIPKLSVQERKKTEQELDRQCEEHLNRKDPLSSWSRAANRRPAEDSPDLKRRRRDERGKVSEADDLKTSRIRNLKPVVSTPPSSNAKAVLSTPPLMSKEERRQQFEAQVKAHDELMQQKVDFEQQQQLQQPQPDSTYTDLFVTPSASSNYDYPDVTQYVVDPQVDRYHADVSTSLVPGSYGSDLIMPLQRQMVVTNYGSDTAMSGPMVTGNYSSNIVLSAPVGVGDQAAMNYGSLPDQSFYSSQPVLQASYQQLAQQPPPALLPHDQIHQPSHNYPQVPVVSNDSYSLVIDPQGQQYSAQGGVYYAVQGTTLLVQQPIYTPSTQQVVHVSNNRTTSVVSRDPRDPPPPPPSPPRHKALRLPPNWKTAKDMDGKLYYYHSVTRQTQWDPPAWDAASVEDEDEEFLDICTPLDEHKVSSRRRHTTTTAAADTSSEVAKRLRDQFRSQIAKHIVACLGPYRRPDCEQGRINTTEEFKLLARKLSYAVMTKELKHCRHLEDLEVNENVKGKAKNFVVKYMSRFPGMYRASNNSP